MAYISENFIYKIIPKISTNKAVQVDRSTWTPVLQNKVNGDRNNSVDDDQNWIFEYDEKFESHKITNVKTKKILAYCNEDNSDHILMETEDMQTPYYRWIFEIKDDGYFVIKNAGDIGGIEGKKDKVLDVHGSGKSNGTRIILHERTNRDNQKFKIVRHKFVEGFKYEEAKELNTPHIQKENTYKTLEDLKYKVFSSDQFIKKWANIAYMLGYRWCTGTRGVDIGEDFDVKRENGKYIIRANYRANDPFVYGVGPTHRLVMEVSDVKLKFDPNSINVSTPTITKLHPTVISTTNAVNHLDKEGTVTTEIEYTVGNTVSNSTSNTISNSISIENSFKLKIQGMKFEESFTYNFGHEKTWAQQEDRTTETKLKSIYTTPVASGSNVPIYALLYQSKADIPYTAKANLEYSIRFIGFLNDDNALKVRHNKNEKSYYSFGDGKIPATKFLEKEYSTRDAYGQDSKWDYTWSILNYDPDYFNKYMSQAITPDKVEISGIFTNIASTNVSLVAGKRTDKDTYEVLHKEDIKGTTDIKPNTENKLNVTVEIEKKKTK